MKEIKVPELTLEGIPMQLVPTKFSTGSVGFKLQQANFPIEGKKHWLYIIIVQQGTRQKITTNV